MFVVTLSQFAPDRRERVERIVHKHSGGTLDHVAREALLSKVAAGQPQVIARYVEEHAAVNAVAECKLQQCQATIASDAAV